MVEKRLLLKDKSSSYHINFLDRIRTFFYRFKKNIYIGENVIIHKKVDIKICDTGKLILGNYCMLDAYSYIQLTKPEGKVIMEDYSTIGRGTILAAKKLIKIGKYTQIGPFCQFNDQDHGFEKNELIMNQKAIIKPIIIGEDCWFGSGVRVLKGVTIGKGCVIGGGSVVTKNIPDYEIWAGNPAKFIKKRI